MALYPVTPKFATVKLRSVQQSFRDRSQSGRGYARKTTGHQWFFTATYQDLSREQMAEVFAFAMSQEGVYGSFTVIPPDLATPRGTALGSPVVDLAGQTGSTLNIKGATADQAAFFKKMDIFSLAGDAKVYMMTENASTDGSGNTTLTFKPPLEISPPDNAVVTVTDVAFTMSYASPMREYGVKPPVLYDFDVDFAEAG